MSFYCGPLASACLSFCYRYLRLQPPKAPRKWFEGPIYRFINRKNEASMRGFSRWLSDHPDFRPDLVGSEQN